MARRKQQWACYAVWVGYKPGIYDTWSLSRSDSRAETEKHWKGYPGGKQCGFKTRELAIAHMHSFGFRQDPDGTWSKAGVVKVVDDADAQSLPGSSSSRPPLQTIQPPPPSLSQSPLSVKPVREDGRPVRAQPRKYWAIWSGRQIGIFHVPWSEMCDLVLGYKGCGFESYPNLGIAEQRMLTEGCTKHADGSWHPSSPPTFAELQPSFVLYDRLAHDIVLGDANDDTSDTTLYYRVVETTQGELMVADVRVTVKETIEHFDFKAMQRALDALQRRSLTWAATIEALEDESTPWEREDIRPRVVPDYNPDYLDYYVPPQCDVDEVKRMLDGTDAYIDVEPSPVELYNGAQGVGRPRMLSTWEVLYVACSPEGGIGVFFGDGNRRNISERYHDPTKAEIVAVARALEAVLDSPSRRILLQTEFKFNWKMLRPRFSALEDPLRTYLSRLFDSYLPRVRIRVQHVEDVYDCGMVREARAAARALAWYPDEEDEAKWDFDWEKKKRLLIDREEDEEEEEAPGLEIYD